jgi:hypothetical protein
MSRGLGRVERAIKALFDCDPAAQFTLPELTRAVYGPECPQEKRHEVALLRAVRSLIRKDVTLDFWRTFYVWGTPVIMYNFTNVMSYAKARFRDMDLYRYSDAELVAKLAPGGDHHQYVIEGGVWLRHTENAIKRHELVLAGDSEALAKFDADAKVRQEASMAAWREEIAHAWAIVARPS